MYLTFSGWGSFYLQFSLLAWVWWGAGKAQQCWCLWGALWEGHMQNSNLSLELAAWDSEGEVPPSLFPLSKLRRSTPVLETFQRVKCVFRTLLTMESATSYYEKKPSQHSVLCLSSHIYLLQISECFWSLWMPGITIENLRQIRLSRRQNSVHPPSHGPQNVKSPSGWRKEL